MYGEDDPTVPFSLSEQLVARAGAVGLPFEFFPVPGAGYGFARIPFFTGGPEPDVAFSDRLLAFAAARLRESATGS